jgi:hypothetical protein
MLVLSSLASALVLPTGQAVHAVHAPRFAAVTMKGGATAFAAKHSSTRDLKTLETLLADVELPFLNRKGKVVATLGPASSSLIMIQKLVAAGSTSSGSTLPTAVRASSRS